MLWVLWVGGWVVGGKWVVSGKWVDAVRWREWVGVGGRGRVWVWSGVVGCGRVGCGRVWSGVAAEAKEKVGGRMRGSGSTEEGP